MATPTPEEKKNNVMKNEFEYKAELLSALINSLQGEEVSFPASMVKDTEDYRKGILEALGMEYTDDDVKHTPVFRSKVIDGVKNMSGGGGGGDLSMAEVKINMSTASGGWTSWGLSSALPILTTQGEIKESVTTFPNGTYTFDRNVIFYQNTPYERDIYSGDEHPVTATVTGNISIIRSEPDAVSVSIAGAGTINVVINDLA